MFVLLYVVLSLISFYELVLLGRVVVSWIPYFQGTAIDAFCYNLTEPVLIPIRNLLSRFEWVRRCPFDLSTLVLFLILGILPRFLVMFF